MSCRAFLEHYSTAWAERAAVRRRSGTAPDLLIADTLERIVADMRAELASLPIAATSVAITWRSPVFNAGGRFNPFAGSHADAMLASADVCDRIGEPGAAAAYRRLAAATEPPATSVAIPAAPITRRRRQEWSGPNIIPAEPTPFVAGPQMEFFA